MGVTPAAKPAPAVQPADEGDLHMIGACLAAIRSMSTHCGAIDEEDARAIYSLTVAAIVEWRKLDAAADVVPK